MRILAHQRGEIGSGQRVVPVVLAVVLLTAPTAVAGKPTADVAVSGDLAAVPHTSAVYRIVRRVKSAKPAPLKVWVHHRSGRDAFLWLAEYERTPDADEGFGSTWAGGATLFGVNAEISLGLNSASEALLVVINGTATIQRVSPGWRVVEDDRLRTFVLRDKDTASSPAAAAPYAVEQHHGGKFRVPARRGSRVDSIVWASLPCSQMLVFATLGTGGADLRGADLYEVGQPYFWRCGGFDTISAVSWGPTTYEVVPDNARGVVGFSSMQHRVVGVTIPR